MPLDGQKMRKKKTREEERTCHTEGISWVVAGSLSGEKY